MLPMLAMVVAACAGGEATQPDEAEARRLRGVASVTISPEAPVIVVGGTVRLSATMRNAEGSILSDRSVSWSTTYRDVAAVDAFGLVTGQTPGTTRIIATSSSRADTVTVTVNAAEAPAPPPPAPAPVASVSVSPQAPSLLVGATAQLSATVRDSAGNVLTGRTVTWTSNATGIATVSATGLVTGVSAGTSMVTASSDGRTASVNVTVTAVAAPPPPPQSGTNEPTGYTVIGDRPFNAVATCSVGTTREAGWDDVEGCPQINGGNFTVVSDPTAPVSASNVAQMRYPLGFAGGSSPAVAQRFWSAGLGYRQLYLRYWIKVSSGFEGHMTSTNKIFHFWIGNPGGNRAFDRLVGVDLGNLDYQLALQGTPAAETRTRLVGNRGVSTSITRGQWYRIEIQLIANTPGSSNGVARAWINGQLAIEYTDIQLVGAGESPVWSQVQWSPTWGGGGDVTTRQFFMWMDQAYISGRQ